MMKKTALIGLMLVLGAMPLAIVNALPIHDTNGCDPATEWEAIHRYSSGGGFTIWEDKDPDRLALLGSGLTDVADYCLDPADLTASDNDYEWGLGGANLPVVGFAPNACRAVTGHHSLNFYVDDLIGEIGRAIGEDGLRAVVSGESGADGSMFDVLGNPTPCGDGLIAPDLDPADCLEPFWGKGVDAAGTIPHTACGVGLDGSYWIFVDVVTVDLNRGSGISPRVGTSTDGCIWTDNLGGKDIKPCLKA